MEVKTVKKMVETEVTIYVAYDGTEFNNQTLCKAYENTEYKKKYENLPYISFNVDEIFSDAYSLINYKAIPVRNKEDIAIINGYLESKGSNFKYVSEDYIGKVIIIAESNNEAWFYENFFIEDMKKTIVANLDALISSINFMKNHYINN